MNKLKLVRVFACLLLSLHNYAQEINAQKSLEEREPHAELTEDLEEEKEASSLSTVFAINYDIVKKTPLNIDRHWEDIEPLCLFQTVDAQKIQKAIDTIYDLITLKEGFLSDDKVNAIKVSRLLEKCLSEELNFAKGKYSKKTFEKLIDIYLKLESSERAGAARMTLDNPSLYLVFIENLLKKNTQEKSRVNLTILEKQLGGRSIKEFFRELKEEELWAFSLSADEKHHEAILDELYLRAEDLEDLDKLRLFILKVSKKNHEELRILFSRLLLSDEQKKRRQIVKMFDEYILRADESIIIELVYMVDEYPEVTKHYPHFFNAKDIDLAEIAFRNFSESMIKNTDPDLMKKFWNFVLVANESHHGMILRSLSTMIKADEPIIDKAKLKKFIAQLDKSFQKGAVNLLSRLAAKDEEMKQFFLEFIQTVDKPGYRATLYALASMSHSDPKMKNILTDFIPKVDKSNYHVVTDVLSRIIKKNDEELLDIFWKYAFDVDGPDRLHTMNHLSDLIERELVSSKDKRFKEFISETPPSENSTIASIYALELIRGNKETVEDFWKYALLTPPENHIDIVETIFAMQSQGHTIDFDRFKKFASQVKDENIREAMAVILISMAGDKKNREKATKFFEEEYFPKLKKASHTKIIGHLWNITENGGKKQVETAQRALWRFINKYADQSAYQEAVAAITFSEDEFILKNLDEFVEFAKKIDDPALTTKFLNGLSSLFKDSVGVVDGAEEAFKALKEHHSKIIEEETLKESDTE